MRNYMIIDSAEVSLVDFEQVLEDSEETLKYSIDRSKTYVKWDGDTPSFLKNLIVRIKILCMRPCDWVKNYLGRSYTCFLIVIHL